MDIGLKNLPHPGGGWQSIPAAMNGSRLSLDLWVQPRSFNSPQDLPIDLHVRDRFVAWDECFHHAPRGEIAQRADDEHDEIGVLGVVFERVCEAAGNFLDDHAAPPAG